jgi:hypothetical protein
VCLDLNALNVGNKSGSVIVAPCAIHAHREIDCVVSVAAAPVPRQIAKLPETVVNRIAAGEVGAQVSHNLVIRVN